MPEHLSSELKPGDWNHTVRRLRQLSFRSRRMFQKKSGVFYMTLANMENKKKGTIKTFFKVLSTIGYKMYVQSNKDVGLKDTVITPGNLHKIAKTCRSANNMTQQALANKIGVTYVSIQNMEYGGNPRVDSFINAIYSTDHTIILLKS